MSENKIGNSIKIMPKPDNISWFEITELLHEAYAEHAAKGMGYSACFQTEVRTRERVGDGLCLVALLDGKLVGTATLHTFPDTLHLCQFAVHPNYRSYGLGRELQKYVFELACKYEKLALVCDTSEKADKVVGWYIKTGWQKVGLVSYATTNFYSVCFRKPVCGRKYSRIESWLRFTLSSTLCRIKFKENGEKRW